MELKKWKTKKTKLLLEILVLGFCTLIFNGAFSSLDNVFLEKLWTLFCMLFCASLKTGGCFCKRPLSFLEMVCFLLF